VLLASVLLHCAAHCTSHHHQENNIRVCERAGVFAESAWAGPVSIIQEVSEAMPKEQLQALLAQAQQLAAAEGEQVVYRNTSAQSCWEYYVSMLPVALAVTALAAAAHPLSGLQLQLP
jgi:hypothetical protein